MLGAAGGNRTPDTQYRKLVLYPLSYSRTPVNYNRLCRRLPELPDPYAAHFRAE